MAFRKTMPSRAPDDPRGQPTRYSGERGGYYPPPPAPRESGDRMKTDTAKKEK